MAMSGFIDVRTLLVTVETPGTHGAQDKGLENARPPLRSASFSRRGLLPAYTMQAKHVVDPSAHAKDAPKDHDISIRCVPSFSYSFWPTLITQPRSYRTLSIQVEDRQLEKPKAGDKSNDPASAIRNIDVHTLSPEDVFARYATSPAVGLEAAAVERRAKSGGKNVISPPKTQYWKKALNYVFGGFNFLMWIAFIVTIVGYDADMPRDDCADDLR